MIAELGHFSLVLALAMAIIQSTFPIMGAAMGNLTYMSLARPAARLQFLFVSISFGILVYSFLINDFSPIPGAFILYRGGWAIYKCPFIINSLNCLKKKVNNKVLI